DVEQREQACVLCQRKVLGLGDRARDGVEWYVRGLLPKVGDLSLLGGARRAIDFSERLGLQISRCELATGDRRRRGRSQLFRCSQGKWLDAAPPRLRRSQWRRRCIRARRRTPFAWVGAARIRRGRGRAITDAQREDVHGCCLASPSGISVRLCSSNVSSVGFSFGNCSTSAQYTALTTAAGCDTGNVGVSEA